jgi:hypothetical protein
MSLLVVSLLVIAQVHGSPGTSPGVPVTSVPVTGSVVDSVVDAGPPPIEPREPRDVEDTVDDAGVSAAAGTGPGSASGAIPNLTLSAAIEPNVAVFGEPFSLVVTIVRERGVRLQMPGSLPDIEGAPRMQNAAGVPMEVRSVDELEGGDGSRVREVIRVPFLALDTVDVETPAFVLTSVDGLTVDVPSLKVKVVVPPDPPDAGPATTPGPDGQPQVVLAPAASTIAYPVPDARPWIALSALLSAAVLYAGVRAAARRRRLAVPKAPPVPIAPPRPAHEVALERLEALLATGMLARGETAVFVERLMDEVLRDYLTARFGLSAGTRTTRELVKDLLGISWAGLDVVLVEGLLADADLVKFAKAAISAERAHAMATRVRALIEATSPVGKEGANA